MLAVDLIGGNGRLALGGHQPVDKALAEFLLYGGMFLRVHEDNAVLIEQALIAFYRDDEIAGVLERKPGAPVGNHIGLHRARRIESGTHALPDLAIPSALG